MCMCVEINFENLDVLIVAIKFVLKLHANRDYLSSRMLLELFYDLLSHLPHLNRMQSSN